MVLNSYPQLPVDYVWISQGFKKGSHYAIDIGYNANNPNPDIVAAYDGEVAMKDKDQYGGLFVVLRHKTLITGKWCYTCYWHLANFATTYKKGDQIKQGHALGKMGMTGNAVGKHLHFEFWIGPEGVTFSAKNRARDAVNPVLYIYKYPHQTVSPKTTGILTLPVKPPLEPVQDDLIKQRDKEIADLKTSLKTAQTALDTQNKQCNALQNKIDNAISVLK